MLRLSNCIKNEVCLLFRSHAVLQMLIERTLKEEYEGITEGMLSEKRLLHLFGSIKLILNLVSFF